MPLLALFIAVPLIEIALFIQVGGWIGLWPTLAIVIVTAFVGTYLVRQQGARELQQLRESFSDLRDPSEPLANGAMILFSGALLLTPGFFTDAVGLALLVPAVRSRVYHAIRSRITFTQFEMGRPPNAPRETPDDRVIDGEFEEIDPDHRTTHGQSGWTRH